MIAVIAFVGLGVIFVRVIAFVLRIIGAEALIDHAAFDSGDFVIFGRVDLDYAAVIIVIIVIVVIFVVMIVFVMTVVVMTGVVATFTAFGASIFLGFLGSAQRGFLGRVFSLFGQQRVTILFGDLVIIGVDFAERQEPVPIAAKVHERGLKRRLHSGYFGEIDIALDLLVISGLEIKFLDAVAFEHRHPGFFRVARIDQHARCHNGISIRGRRGPGREGRGRPKARGT